MRRLALALALAALLPALAAGQEAAPERYLVVTSGRLEAATRPLVAHRAKEGLQTAVFQVPAGDANARREAISAEVKRVKPRYLLLVGDVAEVPFFVVRECATDRPYGDLDEDGYPDVAIGRIPTSSPEVVARVVARTIHYETKLQPGAWQRQVALVAGEARFSPVIDRAIEGVFARVLKEALPAQYDVDLTYANPNSSFCYPPERFADRFVERINEGALVVAYVGHGNKRSVDQLTVKDAQGKPTNYRVLDVRDIPRLKAGSPPPIMFSIACWNGNYDGQRQSIGEELLAAEGGPVAFFGSSRISHPVHNGLLAKELITELFASEQQPRLGPALDRARSALVKGREGIKDPIREQILGLARAFVGAKVIDDEMPRHVDMYNLFGDPALRVATPRRRLLCDLQFTQSNPGEMRVSGNTEDLGRAAVRITLEVGRDREARQGREGETTLERYARANDKILLTELCVTDDTGKFSVAVKLPKALPKGPLYVKVFAQGKRESAASALTLEQDFLDQIPR